MAPTSDTGVSNTDNITSDTTPTITGTGTNGDTITVTMPTGEVLTAVVANGTWTVTPTQNFPVGLQTVNVTATDSAGNVRASTVVPVTIDASTPTTPTVDTLTSNTTTPVLSGTAMLAAGETLTVSVGGAVYAVTPNAQGVWHLNPATSTPLSGSTPTFVDGRTYDITATVTDLAGNTRTDVSAGELTINTSAPSVTLPEAGNGVNEAEGTHNTTSAGGTPLVISLPQNASDGDTVTSTVTKPDGTPLTLTTVLSAQDIANGQIEQIIPTADLNLQGTWITSTTITPVGGSEGPAAPGSFVLDTVAPAAPAADVAALSDTGNSNTDNITNDTTPTISGTGTAGDTITVTMPGTGEVLTTVVASNGSWSVTPTQALAQGTANVSVTATDPAGNTSAATLVPVTIDTAAPSAPAADVAAASDTGTSNTDNITKDNTPTISGTGTAGDTITVTMPGTGEVLTTVVAGNGSWSVTPSQALADGTQNVSVTATDPAGNTSVATLVPVTIDTTPPAPPAADVAAASDSGISPTDNITNDTTPDIVGTGTPGDTIRLYAPDGTTLLGTATVANNGTWSITPTSGLAEGLNTLKVTATDPAGNVSAPTDVSVTIDTTANVPTVVPTLGNTLTPVITGGAHLAPGESLTVTVGGATYAVTPDAQGAWSLNLATATPINGSLSLANGTHNVSAVITDAAGNVGTDVSSGELVIDTGRIAVSLPEAPLGVNAAEAASAGGTPLVCGLPAGAVAGDVVTTVVTRPGTAGTFTLTTILSAADIAAGTITQLIPSSELTNANNGSWTTSTRLNSGTATPGSFTLDTVAPAAPAADVAALSDTGNSNTDNITADNTPTISGSGAAPGDTITVTLPTGEVLTAVVASNGSWAVTPTQALPDGAQNVRVTATDPAGNTSPATTVALVIDTTAPAAPSVAIPEAASGVSAAEAADGVQLTVTLPADARVGDVVTTVVTAPDGSTSTLTYTVLATDVPPAQGGTASGTGPFTITQTVLLATLKPGANYLDGDWTTHSTLTDTAGNVSPAMADGFKLAANPPTISIATVAGDNTVNAAEASGAMPVSGTTTAEPGQTVTVQLMNGATVLGTYTTVVQPDGSYSLNIPQASIPADGNYSLKADVSNAAGTAAAQASQALTVDRTPPLISITSVAGDAIDATHLSGLFDATERGPLSGNAVRTRPVISGTTTAEVGQTVSITIDGQTYTTTVQSGGGSNPNVWSYTLTNAEALSLSHGNTYAITASVRDVAGNLGSDIDNSLVVNIAPPDIPTVVEQYTANHTPTITGAAQKDAGNSTYVNLADGDELSVTVNGVSYSLTIGSTSSPAGLTYANGTWSLVPASIPNGHYEVNVSVTAAGITKTDISYTELHINDAPPSIAIDAISSGTLNAAEKTQALPITGTTDAPVGATVTLSLNGHTYTAQVAADGTFSVTVPGTDAAALADGTQTVTASVVNAYGVTGTGTQGLLVDTTAPGAAVVAIPEGTVVNAAEALSAGGTPLNITLPAGSQAGDVVKTVVTQPDGSVLVLSTTLTAANITAGSISQLIPTSALNTDGAWTTSTTITDTAGNTGLPSTGGFTLDTTAPAAPTAILAASSDSGLAGDSVTNDTTPTLSGAGVPGDTITVKDATGNVIATAIVGSNGTWSATPAAPLAEGEQHFSVTATDPAGNVSAPTDVSVTIDTTANVPTVVPTLGNTLTPVITGGAHLAPGESLTVTVGGATYAVTPDAQGAWSLNLATATPINGSLSLANGTHNVSAVITDAAGNVGTDVSSGELVIDTGRIAVSLPEAPLGVNAAEAASAGGTPLVCGLPAGAVAGDVVTTVVTRPGTAGTFTLTTILSAADIAAGTITQLIPSSELTNANNGSWTTSTRLNSGTATPGSFTLDTVAPAAPAADVAALSDTGNSNTDNITADNTPTISGSGATPGDTITVTLPTGEVLTAVVASNGSWAVTPTQALPDGAQNVSVTATDPAGNTSPATTVALVIDTTPPAAPAADVAAASDTGASNTDNITNDTTPTISGTGTAGDTITVTMPGTGEVLTTVVASNGSWSVTPTQALAQGTANVSVTATDPAGNTSAANLVAVTIDTTPPAAPAADLAITSDSGASNTDHITSDNTPTITGSGATPGHTITVTMPGTGEVLTAVVAANGTWSVTPTQALANGTANVSVTATDLAGNTSPATTVTLVIDTNAPAAPAADVAANSDSGSSNTDNITNDTTPTISGTGTAGDTITVTMPGTGEVLTTVVASNGSWSVTPTQALAQGTANVSVTATDAAGNTSAATLVALTIDTSAPAAPTVSAVTTADTTPVISGTATVAAGEVLTVTISGATYTVVPDAQGHWSVDLGSATPSSGTLTALVNGNTYNVVATVTDAAGNATSDVNAGEVTIDTTPPPTPAAPAAPDMTAGTDSGNSTDNITFDSTPSFAVTAPPAGGTLVLYVDGAPVAATYTPASGNNPATLTPNVALGEGQHTITYAVQVGGTTGTLSQPLAVTIDTVSAITVTSVAGDAVSASGNGTFSLVERGYDTVNYTLNNTVTTPPVISGVTDAEVGRTVTLTLNGQSYTTTVVSGGGITGQANSWSYTLSDADAKLLNHGNSYAITASVSDTAGNTSADTNNGVTINIAPPDVPTVVNQTTTSLTPTITGVAQKLVNNAGTVLTTGDSFTVTIKSADGQTTLDTYTYAVGGSNNSSELSYNTTTGAWSLAVPVAAGLQLPTSTTDVAGNTYNIDVATTTSGVTRNDISSQELTIVKPLTITSIPEAASNSALNKTEALDGTAVNISLIGSGAVAGNAIKIMWDGQPFVVTLTAADIAAGRVTVTVPLSTLQAATANGTSETLQVTASLLDSAAAVGAISTSAASAVNVNFVVPDAPAITSATWTSTVASDTSGIPEMKYEVSPIITTFVTSGTPDGVIRTTEAYSRGGTTVRVAFNKTSGVATAAQVGDLLTLTVGNATPITYTLTSTDVSTNNGSTLITIPLATLQQLPVGTNIPVSATITSASTGNTSAPVSVNIQTAYEVPLEWIGLGSTAATPPGFVFTGQSANDFFGCSVASAGDVNGDGLEDLIVGAYQASSNSGKAYVIYGRSDAGPLNLSAIAAGSGGFVINGSSANAYLGRSVSGIGDVNGDGLADVLVGEPANSLNQYGAAYVIYGSTNSSSPINVSNLAASQGFKISGDATVSYIGNTVSSAGDFNGDGFDDFLTSGTIILGRASQGNINLASATNVFKINGISSSGISPTSFGDFNGDGLDDLVLGMPTSGKTYVVFGKTDSNAITLDASKNFSNASMGLVINGAAATAGDGHRTTMLGDVNGDGLADVGIGSAAGAYQYVVFGTSSNTPFMLSSLSSGSPVGGFAIKGNSGNFNGIAPAGDINGDGLMDIFITNYADTVYGSAYGAGFVVFGRTGSSMVDVDTMVASDGFRIVGWSGAGTLGATADRGTISTVDINGDGFADLVIGARNASPNGISPQYQYQGQTYVVYGGASEYTSLVYNTANGDAIGTSRDDVLGDATANRSNQFVGGLGNDTITGNGGADVMYGGAGDDTFVLNADNVAMLARNSGNGSQSIARMDGGTGMDTIRLDGAGITLDLTAIRSDVIRQVENLDISGSGSNTLKLSASDVLDMGDSNLFNVNPSALDVRKQLMVTADANDKVVLTDLANWTQATGANSTFTSNGHTYDVWNHNSKSLQLLIDHSILQSNITAN